MAATVTPAVRTAYAYYSLRTLQSLLGDLTDLHGFGRPWPQDALDLSDLLCDLIAERRSGHIYPCLSA